MPPPAAGQAQLRTEVSVVSAGTEGWALRQQFTWARTPFPCVPGYQRVGVVTAVGPGVENMQVGERVMATTGVWDGPVKPFWGSHLAVGNTAADQLFAIPAGVQAVDAAGAVVAQVGYNAASRLTLEVGDWVLVYGDGLIGQCASQAARARGARTILVGHRAERLERAARHSADIVIDSHREDVAASVRAATGGAEIAAVLDSVQSEATQREYVPLLRRLPAGQIVYCGFTPGTVWADMGLLQQRELTAYFVAGWTRPRMEATLALMAEGKMALAPLITHHIPAERGPALYQNMLTKAEPFLGIALDWSHL
ncbi:MAG TPA: zinc-binding dehydrogenase [Chthonomonadaceae bacterium]|nr:zinc-binding dehydrogenase [Chthonomonadaceae bacterium]